jgi:hypothetical protein
LLHGPAVRLGFEALKKAKFLINNFLQDSIIVVITPEGVKKIKSFWGSKFKIDKAPAKGYILAAIL